MVEITFNLIYNKNNNVDLKFSVFLSRMQINVARGNVNTRLPENLTRPVSW